MADKFLLATTGTQINMVSSWEDELYCSILKDGSISLRASKNGHDEYGGRWWFKAKRGIKTPKQFSDAFNSIDEIEIDHWSLQEDLLPVLFDHAPLFAALTNKFAEIEYEDEEEELDFFLFSEKIILNAEISLPKAWKSAVKVVEVVYNFVKQEFNSTGRLPMGKHQLMDVSVLFPSKAIRSSKELAEFRKEQKIKTHARNANWEIQRTRLQGFAKSSQFDAILDFCRLYLEEHEKLPIGKFQIAQTEVEFTSTANHQQQPTL